MITLLMKSILHMNFHTNTPAHLCIYAYNNGYIHSDNSNYISTKTNNYTLTMVTVIK